MGRARRVFDDHSTCWRMSTWGSYRNPAPPVRSGSFQSGLYEFDEIVESAFPETPAPPVVPNNSGIDAKATIEDTTCWGGLLQASLADCTPNFVATRGHFKNKLCANCVRDGIHVPVSRICTLAQGAATIPNRSETGVWNTRVGRSVTNSDQFRVINHTARCTGPRIVIFRGEAPSDLHGPPLPERWVHNGMVHLLLSKGTLVPACLVRDATHAVSLQDAIAPCFRKDDLDEPMDKRPRVDQHGGHDERALHSTSQVHSQMLAGQSSVSQSQLAGRPLMPTALPHGWERPSNARSHSADELLDLSERLLSRLTTFLSTGEALGGSGFAASPAVAEQQASLAMLVGPLRASTEVLRRTVGEPRDCNQRAPTGQPLDSVLTQPTALLPVEQHHQMLSLQRHLPMASNLQPLPRSQAQQHQRLEPRAVHDFAALWSASGMNPGQKQPEAGNAIRFGDSSLQDFFPPAPLPPQFSRLSGGNDQ